MISETALIKILIEPDLVALRDILLEIPETRGAPDSYKLCKAAGQFGGFDVIDLVLTHAKTRQSGTGTFMELVLFETLCRDDRTDMVKRFASFVDPGIAQHGIFEACSKGRSTTVDLLLPFISVPGRADVLRHALAFDAITPDIFEILYLGCDTSDIRLIAICLENTPCFFRGKRFGDVSEHVLSMFRTRVKVDLDRDELAKSLDSVSPLAGKKKPKTVL